MGEWLLNLADNVCWKGFLLALTIVLINTLMTVVADNLIIWNERTLGKQLSYNIQNNRNMYSLLAL